MTNNIRNHFERNRITIGSISQPGRQVMPPSFTKFCEIIKALNRALLYSHFPRRFESNPLSVESEVSTPSPIDDAEYPKLLIHDESRGAFQERPVKCDETPMELMADCHSRIDPTETFTEEQRSMFVSSKSSLFEFDSCGCSDAGGGFMYFLCNLEAGWK